MRPINVLVTIAGLDLNSGGPARSVTSLTAAMISEKLKATIFTLASSKNEIIKFDKKIGLDLDIFLKRESSLFLLYNFDQLFKNMDANFHNNKIDIVHNHGLWIKLNHYASFLASKHDIPIIVSPRGMLEPWALNFKKYKKKIALALYQKNDLNRATVLHATAVQEALNFRNLGFRQPIAIVPNGVQIPSLIPIGHDDEKPSHTVLFLSRIHPKKGLLNLVEAWKTLAPKGWKVVIAGPDEAGHQAEVLAHIKNLGLESSFEFVGPLYGDSKWKLFAQSDLFVLPSFSENFGIVIAEALASGVPVITTQSTPWQELETHKCGWWIDVGVEPLIGALREAMALSDAEREAMGFRGRQLVQDSYSWPKIGADMVSVYEWVLGGGAPPSCMMTD